MVLAEYKDNVFRNYLQPFKIFHFVNYSLDQGFFKARRKCLRTNRPEAETPFFEILLAAQKLYQKLATSILLKNLRTNRPEAETYKSVY
jgi:hypothetical protein